MDAILSAFREAPQGSSRSLHIFETLGGTALPLPREVVDGPMDCRWIPNTDRTRLLPPDQNLSDPTNASGSATASTWPH